jgi:hypothetical protein
MLPKVMHFHLSERFFTPLFVKIIAFLGFSVSEAFLLAFSLPNYTELTTDNLYLSALDLCSYRQTVNATFIRYLYSIKSGFCILLVINP